MTRSRSSIWRVLMPMANAVTARRRRVGSSRKSAGCRGRDGDRRPEALRERRGLQPLLDLSGVVVDGLPAAPGLLGLAGDGPVTPGEDGGGVADEVRSDSVLMGEALRDAGDRGCEPVDHGAASPSRSTVNPAEPISAHFATEPPTTPESLGLEAGLGGLLLLQQADRQPSQQAQVLAAVARVVAALVFAEHHIQHPVQ